MTSGTPFPHNLTEIDELTRPDHSYLDVSDKCYFLGEYTARKGYAYSETNNLVINLKKSPNRKGRSEWQYKERAIEKAAHALNNAIPEEWLREATFVPIPPSKTKSNPMYDDRMIRILRSIDTLNPVDCRDIIRQKSSTDAAHDSDERPGPNEILANYELDNTLLNPAPDKIIICDDVLTTGAHFKAAKMLLQKTFPEAAIAACFIARRVPEAVDVEEFFDDVTREQ